MRSAVVGAAAVSSSELAMVGRTQAMLCGRPSAMTPSLVRLPPRPSRLGRAVAAMGSLSPSPVGPRPVPGVQPRF